MSMLRLVFASVVFASLSIAAQAQTVITIGSGFDNPYGIDLDSAGNVIVADSSGGGSVKRILAAGGYTTVQTLASGTSAIIALDVDNADNIYFSEISSAGVKRVLAAGGYTTVQNLFATGVVVAALEVDGAANVYSANAFDGAVRRYQAAGGYVTAPLLGSGFTQPSGIALDAASNVYVADFGNNQVKRILAAGNYTTVQTLGSGFQFPAGVAVDANGDVYVAEYTGAVKRILAAGGYTTVTTLATGLLRPVDLAVDAAGDVYVSDADGDKVVKILMSVVPTTTAVTSNINPSVFRQNVTFTATVTGNNPTGFVNVYTGTDLVCGGILLPAGGNQLSCSSTALLAMSHSITAVYSGNAFNGASTSPPLTQVVNKAATVTSVNAAGPITLAQSVSVSSTIAVTAPGGGVPTGVIGISDGAVSCNIVLPLTSCNLTPTSTGLRTITASYAGDANYIASSNTASLTVNPPATSTALSSSNNPSVSGQSVTFTATITGNTPTGTVNFVDGAVPLCANVAVAGGQAVCTSTALVAGTHVVTAVYSGDSNNATSTSSAVVQVVIKAATITSVTAPGPIALGQSATVTATLAVSAPGAGTPTGTIGISDGSASCSIVLPATSCSLTPTTVGARTITAIYSGDVNFNASSNSASLTVNPAVSGTALASNSNPSVSGQAVTFTATITGSTPTGTVNFLDGAAPLCTSVALVSTQASCTSAALAVGPHSITAVYAGDANNVTSTSSVLTQVVNQAATITSVSAAGPITLGQSVAVTATVAVSAPGAGTATGTIGISDGAATCNIVLPATSCSLTPTIAGARTISASYSGDANFAASTGTASLTVTAPPSTQTITVVAPGVIDVSEGSVVITATASSGLTVTVTSNTPNICSVAGTGSFTVTLLAPGLCTLTANQAGDASNAPVSVTINLQVQAAGEAVAIPALDRWALLSALLMLGLVGTVRARRA